YRLMRKPPGASTPLPGRPSRKRAAAAPTSRAPLPATGCTKIAPLHAARAARRLLELGFELEVDVLRLPRAHDHGAAQAIVEPAHLEAMAPGGQGQRVLAAVFAAHRVVDVGHAPRLAQHH